MKRGLLITLGLIFAFVVSIILGYYSISMYYQSEKQYSGENKLAEHVEDKIVTASSAENVVSPNSTETEDEIVDNDSTYILKEYNGCIAVYRVERNNELVLEYVTDSLTKYLSDEDLLALKNGIIANGINELTHLLEDFEQ